jgi:hypothetical protein
VPVAACCSRAEYRLPRRFYVWSKRRDCSQSSDDNATSGCTYITFAEDEGERSASTHYVHHGVKRDG